MQREGLKLLVHGEVTRPDHRPVRSRGRLHRPGVRAAAPRPARAEGRVRAHHHEGGRAVRRPRPTAHRGHDHRAPPAVQPQRALHGRNAAALLLPAGAQARGASPGAGGRGHVGQRASSSSAPTARRTRRAEGGLGLRRRLLHASAVALELYAEAAFDRASARSTSWKASRATTAPTSTACRATPARSRCAANAARGAARDALTLFDENAILFACADASLAAALRAFDWRTLFVEQRAAWGLRCEVRIFGHALLEKLVAPYKACTGHAWIVEVEPAYFSATDAGRRAILDHAVSERLKSEAVSSRYFTPLPVLGVPGWWPENEVPSFYDDPQVFRSGRRSRS
jgi:hypothetical protein